MTEQGRWTKAAGEHGEDPRDIDEERADPERARTEAETRPVVNDQEPAGEQGISSDRPGVDPGGYPEKRAIEATEDDDA
jgi:hypothetical protein